MVIFNQVIIRHEFYHADVGCSCLTKTPFDHVAANTHASLCRCRCCRAISSTKRGTRCMSNLHHSQVCDAQMKLKSAPYNHIKKWKVKTLSHSKQRAEWRILQIHIQQGVFGRQRGPAGWMSLGSLPKLTNDGW